MPRTPFTAKKSTGAPADRVELDAVVPPLKPKPKPYSRASTPPVKGNAQVLVKVRKGENEYCSLCRNGGLVTPCTTCLRVFCDICLLFPKRVSKTAKFSCPGCHLDPDKDGKRHPFIPYKGFLTGAGKVIIPGELCQREFLPRCSTEPVCIIWLRLSSVPRRGLPPILINEYLIPYLHDNVDLVEIEFDFSQDGAKEQYTEDINSLVQSLSSGSRKRFKTFAVFISTHSDPTRGDLHYMSDDRGANTVTTVLNLLFPPNLRNLMTHSSRNTLTLLVCGAVVRCLEPRRELQAFVKRTNFQWIMTFGQTHFQACIATPYLQAASLQWFIYGRSPVKGILADQQFLGAHSSIVMFYPNGDIISYNWSHPVNSPFGTRTPIQCKGCGCLKPWVTPVQVVRAEAGEDFSPYVILVCGHCKKEQKYTQRETQVQLMPGDRGGSAGQWYYEHITLNTKLES